MADEKVLVDRASLLRLCRLTIAAAKMYEPTSAAGELLRDELVTRAENIRGPLDLAEAGNLIPKRFRNLEEK